MDDMASGTQHSKQGSSASEIPERDHEAQTMRTGDEDLRPEIAERAYARHLAYGGGDGHELQDWFEAEREVRERSR